MSISFSVEANGLFLNPLRKSENHRLCDVFRGYRERDQQQEMG